METLGGRIILLRERAEITQVKLSYLIGVTKSTMSKYENDKSLPNAGLLGKIADALDTTADYLIGRTSDSSPRDKGKDWVQLSESERSLLERYRLLSAKNRIKSLERIETLLDEQGSSKKSTD